MSYRKSLFRFFQKVPAVKLYSAYLPALFRSLFAIGWFIGEGVG